MPTLMSRCILLKEDTAEISNSLTIPFVYAQHQITKINLLPHGNLLDVMLEICSLFHVTLEPLASESYMSYNHASSKLYRISLTPQGFS